MRTIAFLMAATVFGGCSDRVSTGQRDQAIVADAGGVADANTSKTTVFHSSMKGGGGAMMFGDTSGTYGSVNAYENGVGPSRTASLQFTIQGPDPASQVCTTYTDPWWGPWTYCYYTGFITEWGWGVIPTTDFTLAGNGSSARLHTTTTADFFIQRCTTDWFGNWNGCTTGGSETFDLSWNTDGMSASTQTGTTEMTAGAYTSRTAGHYEQATARVTGTAAGHAIGGPSGWGMASLQDTKGVNVTRDIVTH